MPEVVNKTSPRQIPLVADFPVQAGLAIEQKLLRVDQRPEDVLVGLALVDGDFLAVRDRSAGRWAVSLFSAFLHEFDFLRRRAAAPT